MTVALLGGTGDIGEGLALRLAVDTDRRIIIGSREVSKAQTAASEYKSRLADRSTNAEITGAANAEAVDAADIVILAIPPFHVGDTVESIASQLDEQILVTPGVGMQGDDDGLHYHPPDTGSVTELIAERAPSDVPVVGAFHNLSAERLADLDSELDLDTLIVGDDPDAKDKIRDLANEIVGLRALDAGPLANAAEVESVTPLVINIARYSEGMQDVGVKFI
ncbi:NADPH-dependent F420 reductase [Natronomonas gomsonensis]|uniref:NADPH-dependent F420 reductase n=1 Tax=Natronomonas gomsonensis TaxID=1046043 RepID=UPI0020CA37FF|nr:NADPH-dependent F420 reductase [Natronomonas gomsonensis]MCY4731562.1 NADPH-dependent F420 reductase [Natronomonas gomsonensis]